MNPFGTIVIFPQFLSRLLSCPGPKVVFPFPWFSIERDGPPIFIFPSPLLLPFEGSAPFSC